MTDIRRATLDEVPAIAAVHARAHLETYQPLLGTMTRALDVGAQEQLWRQALADGDLVLVATVSGNIVGVGHARRHRMQALYLLAAYRRRGIGKLMLTKILRLLHQDGIPEMEFDVFALNANAIAFYRACGARQTGSVRNTDPAGDYDDATFSIATNLWTQRLP